jgi:DNA-binding NarL/FixJ family response regulator
LISGKPAGGDLNYSSLSPEFRRAIELDLTSRQLEVLRHRLNGHSYRKIGDAMNLHEATVRGHYQAALKAIEPYSYLLKGAA